MPWIVVIPLGLMVVGMVLMFTWQYTRPPDRKTTISGPIGAWLLFLGVIEGAIGVGMMVGEARADGSFGGFGIAAVALLATSFSLLGIGALLTFRAVKQRRIAESGTPGHARVVSMSETGSRINHQPVIAYELEVTVPGRAPYVIVKRITTPLIALSRIGPGDVLSVKVDPADQKGIFVDWSVL